MVGDRLVGVGSFRLRLGTVISYCIGAEGPVRTTLDRLRQVGVGERVIKSAIAGGLAWEIAQVLPGNGQPVLAPITAVFSISLTVAGSVREGIQRILGVIFGVLVAVATNAVLGANGWTITLVVLIAFVAGRRLRLEASGVSQMAVSALIVALGARGPATRDAALLHVANSVIGTAVGLTLNAVFAPPNYLPAARESVVTLGQRIGAILDDLASALANGVTEVQARDCLERARLIATSLDDVEDSITRAEESLKYNVLAGRQRARLAVYHRANRALEHAALQTRVICRAVVEALEMAQAGQPRPGWLEPERLGTPLANLISALSVALDHFLSLIDAPRESLEDEVLATEVQRQRKEVMAAAQNFLGELMPEGWAVLGQALALSDQLVTDLTAAANELGQLNNRIARS
ncbi:MAG: hypothetical protein KatS3mg059_1066 [Thermomicrobiales bacterium]|nr:MAG: hypothetical protein KatS3mg059_1066 [Thermomicrobiales bacterium]